MCTLVKIKHLRKTPMFTDNHCCWDMYFIVVGKINDHYWVKIAKELRINVYVQYKKVDFTPRIGRYGL